MTCPSCHGLHFVHGKPCEECRAGLEAGMRQWAAVMGDWASVLSIYASKRRSGILQPVELVWYASAKVAYDEAKAEHDRLENLWWNWRNADIQAQDAADLSATHADALV